MELVLLCVFKRFSLGQTEEESRRTAKRVGCARNYLLLKKIFPGKESLQLCQKSACPVVLFCYILWRD